MKQVRSPSVMLAVILCVVSGCGVQKAIKDAEQSEKDYKAAREKAMSEANEKAGSLRDPAYHSSPSSPLPDPVAEFKEILSRIVTDRNKKVLQVSYDVTKTDSLVSPLQGTVRYSYPPDQQFGLYWRALFFYQDKKWVLRRVCYTTVDDNTYCDDDGKNPDAITIYAEERAAWEAGK